MPAVASSGFPGAVIAWPLSGPVAFLFLVTAALETSGPGPSRARAFRGAAHGAGRRRGTRLPAPHCAATRSDSGGEQVPRAHWVPGAPGAWVLGSWAHPYSALECRAVTPPAARITTRLSEPGERGQTRIRGEPGLPLHVGASTPSPRRTGAVTPPGVTSHSDPHVRSVTGRRTRFRDPHLHEETS